MNVQTGMQRLVGIDKCIDKNIQTSKKFRKGGKRLGKYRMGQYRIEQTTTQLNRQEQRQEYRTGLEISVGRRTLTDGNAILSNGTVLPSNTMTDGELQEK